MAKVSAQTAQTAQATETIATETKQAIAPVVPIVAAPTSAKLDELKAARKSQLIAAREFEPDSDGEANCLLEAHKIDILIKAELANIANIEQQAKLQIARNERIALNTAQFVALFGSVELFEAFKAAQWEQSPETQLAFEAANEAVNNELLSKFAGAKAAPKQNVTGEANKASDGENLAAHIANIAAGMTDAKSRKALEQNGVPRSTAWHTVNNYNKSLVK